MSALAKLARCLPPKLAWSLRRRIASRRYSLSQVGQDFWVAGEVFNGKRSGFFVDIGAADGYDLSNTYLLESRYNWRGICVEANPDLARTLRVSRRAVCVNACIDGKSDRVVFEKKGLFGAIVDPREDAANPKNERIAMQTTTLLDLLDGLSAPREIDYLSIDVEGAEERILLGFDFTKYTFRCITIERPSAQLRRVLAENKYELVKNVPGLDAFYVHDSFLGQYANNAMAFWAKRL